MRNVSIQQALQRVVDNPVLESDELISLPVHELVCRTLFEIANGVQTQRPRTMARANKAREMIFLRLIGRRRPGSHPATKQQNAIKFVDLTGEIKP